MFYKIVNNNKYNIKASLLSTDSIEISNILGFAFKLILAFEEKISKQVIPFMKI